MEEEEKIHIVEFDMYCPACKYYYKDQADDPCHTCLSIPARENSRKPEKWEAQD